MDSWTAKHRCYTSGRTARGKSVHRGGAPIIEVIRRAWNRPVRKQWLILYPLALAIINTLAFLAVYAAGGDIIRWSAFFTANYDRWQYVRDHFFEHFTFTPTLAVAMLAGLGVCVFAAMIRAPYYRAIAGPTYPLAPRKWEEAGNLLLYYLLSYLVTWVVPLAVPLEGRIAQLVSMLTLVIAILIVFADYVIVFEDLGFLPALRRGLELLTRRWIPVLVVFVVLWLVDFGLHKLYGLYYDGATQVFILLPISHILVNSVILLFVDLFLIYLYEDARRSSPR